MSSAIPQKADVIVVGAGATGIAMAARLAEAGKRVVIFEAGPARSAANMVSSTLHARRLKWSGPRVIEEGSNPVGHVFNTGFGVGGSAIHHYAVWPRMHEEDFEMRSRYGRGLDWPLRYSQLAPYYDQIQSEAGVSGDATQEIWRPEGAPYPMPGVPLFAQGKTIARGFLKLGKRVAPLPLAVTSVAYRGRAACIWDGWCDAGCPIGALANPLTIHLPRALNAGATLITDTAVTLLKTNEEGTRVAGVEVLAADLRRHTVTAEVVVLAAFAIENPRLLLASANQRHPTGLGNANDLVGRYIMIHSAGLVYGLFDEDTECHMGAFGGQLLNQDSYPKRTHGARNAFGSYQWMIAQAVKPNDLLGIAMTRPDLYGKRLDDFMRRAARGFAGMQAVCETLPVADNRVLLAAQTDDNGARLARVIHTTHESSNELWRASLEEGKAVMAAAGAAEVWTGPQAAMHIMGGTIMGRSARESVTDQHGEVHGIANLFITGPGLFPTSGGVNPTFTAHALAARAAEVMVRRLEAPNIQASAA
ncbi:MAG: GMC family oxidoreductase [Pseudomonadota bacterium]|nr:GMC family oxidoreductase [Pseudomonadota bacterium]